ncbi:hypothetical protein CLV92_12025 [Kineococcus xinjiangensis]|uniref:Uncharacterized protein n=1 Tax=Kineococcus xinjiangensis TaxID=512762 RepID=A0A2S6ICH4_9ACTN|nr:hypothetical protein [Kineococcus xinjiangensis]PPK91906.1 hypothetical protein CLV92_12025 [Kineococcus xinjiangensis]
MLDAAWLMAVVLDAATHVTDLTEHTVSASTQSGTTESTVGAAATGGVIGALIGAFLTGIVNWLLHRAQEDHKAAADRVEALRKRFDALMDDVFELTDPNDGVGEDGKLTAERHATFAKRARIVPIVALRLQRVCAAARVAGYPVLEADIRELTSSTDFKAVASSWDVSTRFTTRLHEIHYMWEIAPERYLAGGEGTLPLPEEGAATEV